MLLNVNLSNLGFVILNPESNAPALSKTMRTIGDHYSDCPALCVLGKKSSELKENQRYSNTVIGGDTITSLIDAGVQKSRTEWCFILTAGTLLRYNSLKKYRYFLRSEKEILYPVVDRKFAFDEASINGILMPKRAIEEVGEFGDCNYGLQFIKLIWAVAAMNRGYKLKALVGAKII